MNHSVRRHLSRILEGEGLAFPQSCDDAVLLALYHIARRIRPPVDDKERQNLERYENNTGAQIQVLCNYFSISPPAQYSHEDLRQFLRQCLAGQPADNTWQARLTFWKKVLAHFDLSALGSSESIQVETYDLSNPEVTRFPPRTKKPIKVSSFYQKNHCGWWMVFSAMHQGKRDEGVLFAIPLSWSAETRAFGPACDAMPRINRNWMEPPNPYDQKNGYCCSVDDYARWFREHPLQMDADNLWPWERYFQYVSEMILTLTGKPLLQLHHAAGEDRAELQWDIVPDSINLNSAHIEAIDAAVTGEAPLLRSCVDPQPIAALPGTEQLGGARRRHLAHMDTYDPENGKRKGFALESSQRRAVQVMQDVPDDRLLAVNGPPGTGKTSFLRSVISTLWVQAALEGGSSPIILATAYTNKAVTNIIESFAAISGPELRPEWESRWLPNLPSYGWFLPAKSREKNYWEGYMALRVPEGNPKGAMIGQGLAETFFAEVMTGTDAIKKDYLRLHAACTGSTPCTQVSAAVTDIQRRLQHSVGEMHGWQDRLESLCRKRMAVQEQRIREEQLRTELAGLEEQINGIHRKYQSVLLAKKQNQIEREKLIQTWDAYRQQVAGTDQLRQAQAMAATVRSYQAEIEAIESSLPEGLWARIWGGKARKEAEERKQVRRRELDAQLQAIASAPLPKVAPPPALDALLQEQQRLQSQSENLQKKLATLQKNREAIRQYLHPLEIFRTELGEITKRFRACPWGRELATLLLQLNDEDVSDLVPTLWDRLEEALDLQYRFQHFHLAARYWEGRWLDQALRKNTDTHEEYLAHLRHLAMLAPVIVATTHTLPRARHWQGEYGFADLLIFDEAGQCPPELGCAMFALARRAIVVGDIYQLEPIWSMAEPDEKFLLEHLKINELGVEGEGSINTAYSVSAGSVMQVAQKATAFCPPESGHPAGIPLQAHYRCRETIIDYCRELIYQDDLRPMRKDEPSRCPYPPMSWVAVANAKPERSNGSWKSLVEAQEIVGWLADEKDRLLAAYGATDIAQLVAIIAPFRAQAEAIKALVQRHPALGPETAKSMIINTVHSLQGAEIPIVAFSLTQVQAPFFANGAPEVKPNLLNVAVSRAQDAFVLFAAPEVLHSGGSAPAKEPLAILIDFLRRRGQRLYPRELVVIESPQKAEHITRALGRSAQVLATAGHFMDIANWPMGQPPRWERSGDAFFSGLDEALHHEGQFDHLVLATDDDRDGEEIAWHVLRAIRDRAPRLVSRSLRMRFHTLEPDTLRVARQKARPGLNLRIVQASLLKRLADYRFAQRTEETLGHRIGRNQIATLSYLSQAEQLPENRYRVVVRAHCRGREYRAYPVFSRASTAATHWMRQEDAWRLSTKIAQRQRLPFLEIQSVERDYPAFPPQTTVRFLISGWRRYHWDPQESAMHLQNLYYGRFHTVVRQAGTTDLETGDSPWGD